MNTLSDTPDWVKRKRGRPPIPAKTGFEWARLHYEKGWSIRGIARYFGYAPSTVHKYVKKYRGYFRR